MTGVVVWFTGLPAAGKTTLAERLRQRLLDAGVTPCVLDGDVVRRSIAPLLGYSDQSRGAFYGVLAELAAELSRQGHVVLVPATAHKRRFRQRARQLAPRFVEVWVTTPLAECRSRDDKGLYAAAAQEPGTLPGVGVEYEPPTQPEVTAAGGHDEAALGRLLTLLHLPS